MFMSQKIKKILLNEVALRSSIQIIILLSKSQINVKRAVLFMKFKHESDSAKLGITNIS
jgi:hypothetical protein